MTAEATQTRADAAAVYQQQLEELALEIQAAMRAIASNAITRLEESIARQEMICASLPALARAMGLRLSAAAQPFPAGMDASIEARIHTTNHSIRDLNLEYAALLKHSGRSIALLSNLCRSHQGQFPEARGTRVNQSTWSCQV